MCFEDAIYDLIKKFYINFIEFGKYSPQMCLLQDWALEMTNLKLTYYGQTHK